MVQIQRSIASIIVGALVIFSVECVYSQTNAPQEFVPGEILVGFSSRQDGDNLVNNLNQTTRSLRSGDHSPAGITVERHSDTSLTLKIDFSANTRSVLRGAPGDEAALLQSYANQIKSTNSGVTYAHPNWILRIDPPNLSAPSSDTQLQLQSFTPGSGQLTAQQAPGATPNDPLYVLGLQWHYRALPGGMNAEAAWRAGITGSSDIVVAVLDTGFLYDHKDVQGSSNVAKGFNFVSRNLCNNEVVTRSDDATDLGDSCSPQGQSSWHGSHVAGVIGGVNTNNGTEAAGINWNITVVPVRVLGPGGGTTKDIVDAIRWSAGLNVAGVPKIPKRADIINMSLGGRRPCTPEAYGAVREAIIEARAQGTVVVVAAGNGSYLDDQNKLCRPGSENCKHRQEDLSLYSPASCPGVISVAAHDASGFLAPYSNFGSNVSVMAPGGDEAQRKEITVNGKSIPFPLGVWSIVKDCKSWGVPAWDFCSMNGTSQAAPHVTGAIALAMSKDSSLRGNPDLVAQRLRASAVPPPAGACPSNKPCGPGQLDVMRLIESPSPVAVVLPQPPAIRPPGQTPAVVSFEAQCAKVSTRVDGGRIIARGFVGKTEDLDRLRQLLSGQNADIAVEVRPWPQCEVLLTLDRALVASDRPTVAVIGGASNLVRGQTMGLEVIAPSAPSQLHVAYFQADGSVAHLVQSDATNLRTFDRHAKIIFGDGQDGRPTFKVSPPFGAEMIVVIGSRAPIFPEPRPKVETDREFLAALRRALLWKPDPTAPDRDVTAAYVAVVTKEN